MINNGDLTKVEPCLFIRKKIRVALLNGTKPVKVTVVSLCAESFPKRFLCFLNTVTAQNHDNDFSDFPELRIS